MKKVLRIGVQLLVIISLLSGCNSLQKNNSDNEEIKIDSKTDKLSIAEKLVSLEEPDINKVIANYKNLKKGSSDTYNFNDPDELNGFGYQLLNQGKTKDAIKIFQLLVSEFPNSSNPYDSLGEAYHADGNKEMAIVNYEKSLEIDPKNINAEDWLTKNKYADYDDTRFNKKYTISAYKKDLDELGRRLTEINPNAYKFITKEDFWKAIETKKQELTPTTTFSEFIWMSSEIIANISCSHTSMGYFNQERKMIPDELRFPLEVKLIKNKLLVSNPLINEGEVSVGDEITAINGRPFSEIKAEIYKHISSQGSIETYKKNFLNSHSTSIIAYALGFPRSYKVQLKSDSKIVPLKNLTNYVHLFDKVRKNSETVVKKTEYDCDKSLCLTYVQDGKTAIMKIQTFAYYGSKFPEYKNFLDQSFEELKSKNVKNLIIDVRGNGGGPSDAGVFLLKYLSENPFTYFSSAQFKESLDPEQPFKNVFKGKLWFTMDGNGGSTTGHFMSIVKDLDLATMIGEELGSNQFCTGGQRRLRLPNTGIQFSVARNTYVTTAKDLPIDRGIMPDHFIEQSLDDYLNQVDTVMEFTLSLLEKE